MYFVRDLLLWYICTIREISNKDNDRESEEIHAIANSYCTVSYRCIAHIAVDHESKRRLTETNIRANPFPLVEDKCVF